MAEAPVDVTVAIWEEVDAWCCIGYETAVGEVAANRDCVSVGDLTRFCCDGGGIDP